MRPTEYSRHPLPINILNALRPVLDVTRLLPRIEVDQLIRKAQKTTGLTDFGNEWFREPLGVLVRSINEEANLSSLGRIIVHKRLHDCLATRLRAAQNFKKFPEILDMDPGHTFVIAGLQRTGTTLLHRLLSSDPRVRAPLSWEALNPAPLEREEPGNPEGRIRLAKFAENALRYISPDFFAIHPVEWDMPEEDVLLLDISFMSQSSEATMHVPSYASWLETEDPIEAYIYLRQLMQLLLWQNPARNCVLKSPHHMEHIDTILKVFPKSTIIQTHRDPQKTMASFVSMVCHGAGMFSDEVDVLQFSAHWQRKVGRLIDRSLKSRTPENSGRFIDVAYNDLIGDPIGELRRIYLHAGVAFDEEVEQNALQLLERQVQHKFGRHSYRLEDFGMSREQIERDFGFYRERYAIPYETDGESR